MNTLAKFRLWLYGVVVLQYQQLMGTFTIAAKFLLNRLSLFLRDIYTSIFIHIAKKTLTQLLWDVAKHVLLSMTFFLALQ